MVRASFVQMFACILIASLLALLLAPPAQAQSSEDIRARNRQAVQLINRGKYAEAVKLAEQTLALAEKALGLEHLVTLTSVNNLGFLYQAQGRYGEAEPRSEVGEAALVREVQALRCGLDYTAWRHGNCEKLTGNAYSADHYPSRLPPFDAARAHRLYKALFGGVEDLLKDKTHLLIVPSGALTQLPPQVLVTDLPIPGQPLHWLIRKHAISILPAVSSLKALRATARPRAARKPMIGFGNPLLNGLDARSTQRADQARQKQSCPRTILERVASLVSFDRSLTPFITRGLAKPVDIRRQPPLPETADELCEVAAPDRRRCRRDAATERKPPANLANAESP